MLKKWCGYGLLALCCVACSPKKTTTKEVEYAFSADSAYAFVQNQVDFGPRVPATEAHYRCAKYLEAQLSRTGATVSVEQGQMPNYAGEEQPIYNIVASFNPSQKGRVLLCAHWDTRPWADQEEDYALRRKPIDGANDGASGVGVLLEVARQLGQIGTSKGIDIVFFDAEDGGTPTFYTGKEKENTWCLGAQLWASRCKAEGRNQDYQYGILLDMVGAPDAVFPKEYYSMQYAQSYVAKIWRTAQKLGYGNYFIQEACYPITDDHYYVNTLSGIPCVDIIHRDPQSETGFAPYWHTLTDDMRNIYKGTLQAVGLTVLYSVLTN